MKVYNFFLLLTCVALSPSLISSNLLSYGSNQVEGSTALNFYGSEVCPRESQSFAVGSPAMSIDELLGISSGPFEQLEGGLLWENGQALVEEIEETAQLMAEKVQEGVAPVVEKTEEAVECVEAFVIESYEDLLQFYELFPWFNEEAEEECVEEEQEEVGKTTEADVAEEGKELEAAVAVVEQQIAPVAEEEVPESLREAEKKKVLRMLSSIISVGFLGSLALAFLSIASVVYAMLKEDAESKQQFPEMLTRPPPRKNNNKNRRRKTAALAKALTAPEKPLALPAPPKKDQADSDALPWPLDGECSSETNVSMEDVSQSCA